MSNVIRAYDAQIDSVDKADRSLVARINTAGTDRYRTVIDPRGGKLDNYRKNPAVLWEHGKDPRRFTDPIGRNIWVRHNGGQRPTELLARTKFLTDDFSQQRFEWYRDGVLNAFSVNILPVAERCSPPTREELRAIPEWETAETIYREWDLAEYSGTTIPGNADCLVAGRAMRMLDLVGRGLLWIPDEARDACFAAEARFTAERRTATESMGGASEGGELVSTCPECKKPRGKGKDCCDCDKEKRSAPYIDTDGQTWTVRAADGTPLAMYDEGPLAESSLALLLAARPGSASGYERASWSRRSPNSVPAKSSGRKTLSQGWS